MKHFMTSSFLAYKGKLYTCTLLLLSASSFSSANTLSVTLSEQSGGYEIAGMDFGKSPNIILHDDFESGASGQGLIGYDLGSSDGLIPVYSDETFLTGRQSGKSSFIDGNYNSTAEFKNINGLRSAYLNYYFKVEHVSGDRSRNVKLARITAGYSGGYLQPRAGLTLFDNHENGYSYLGAGEGEGSNTKWFGSYSDGNWHRVETYVELSSVPGAPDGQTLLFLDGKEIVNEKNIVTDITGRSFEWLTLPYYVAHSPGGDYNIYYDNLSLSENMARVEVCDKPSRVDCTEPALAKIESWSNKTISIDLSALRSTSDKYIYVFRADGSPVNTKGIYMCMECPKAPLLTSE